MKTQQHPLTNSSKQTGKPGRKNKRRHTRIHLDALRPKPMIFPEGSPSNCPKCQGLVFYEAGETMRQMVIRCLNCGWQPHFQTPIIQETPESRVMRNLTNQFVSGCDWDRLPVGW